MRNDTLKDVSVIATDIDKTALPCAGLPGGRRPNHQVVGSNASLLSSMHKRHNIKVHFLTNRPAGHVEQMRHFILPEVAEGDLHLCESGAVQLLPKMGVSCIDPRFMERFSVWSEQRKAFVAQLSLQGLYRPMAGGPEQLITLVNAPLPGKFAYENENYFAAVKELLAHVYTYLNGSSVPYYCARGAGGRMVDIGPRQFSKQHGADVLLAHLRAQQERGEIIYCPDKCLWVGDGRADIPAARVFADEGWHIAAVSTADERYSDFVSSLGKRGRVMNNDKPCETSFHSILSWFDQYVLQPRLHSVSGMMHPVQVVSM